MAIAFGASAQDTIFGVVSRVAAPYFEQNVCDSRFAIAAEGGTYFVMVDNSWPNPYLEDLVIHYDTIPIGDEIEVMGTIMEMEDGNGNAFQTIDISKNLNSTHRQIFGFFGYSDISYPGPDPVSTARFFHYNGTELYYITINGELQTENPLMVNGRTLVNSKRYLFVGDIGSWTDYNGNSFNVFELIDALPYDVEDIIVVGTLTADNNLCLMWPCEDSTYLSVFDGEKHIYLTNKLVLRNLYTDFYIKNAFGNETLVVAGGFEAVHYDLFGQPFTSMEVIKMQTDTQRTHTGVLGLAGTPYIGMGTPIPGVCMEFYSDWIHYIIDNPMVWDSISNDYLYNAFVVGNDTVYFDMGQTATVTFVPNMTLNNYRNTLFWILITEVSGMTGLQETNVTKIQVYPNPADEVFYLSCEDQSIAHVDIFDSKGCLLQSKSCESKMMQIDCHGSHGLLFLRIILCNGKVISKKIVIK